MKRCSFFCAGGWPFIVLPLLLLLPLLFFNWHSIEEKIAQNTSVNLQAEGLDWVEVETFNRGRDVLLSGTAPSQEAIDKAVAIAGVAKGVRRAEFRDAEGSIAMPVSPTLNANAQDGVITLTGVLTSQNEIEQLVNRANTVYGESNVVNELLVGDNTAGAPDIGQLFSSLAVRGLADDFNANLYQGQLTLKGIVPSDDVKASIGQEAASLFSGEVLNQLTVVRPAPEPAPIALTPVVAPIQSDVCESLVNELLTSEKINFQTGKATISQQSFSLLDSLAATAKRCSDARFEVAGHTDSVGRLESNMRLSQARAQSVVSYLIKLGLNAEQFSAMGYGPNQPIADNASAQGRATNRRIEFKLKN